VRLGKEQSARWLPPPAPGWAITSSVSHDMEQWPYVLLPSGRQKVYLANARHLAVHPAFGAAGTCYLTSLECDMMCFAAGTCTQPSRQWSLLPTWMRAA